MGPSPSARALRLDALRVAGPGALSALLGAVPEPPPWDAQVATDDPVAGLLVGAGFEVYAETVTVARRLAGMRAAPHVTGIQIAPYRNEWADAFLAAEAAAMAEDPFYREMGGVTGFATAAGQGVFVVARSGEAIAGFGQAAVPEGWINWFGVIPEERRKGIGTALLGEIARAVAAARGTHLVLETTPGNDAHAFWRAQGFSDRGRSLYLIRRA